MLNNMLNNLLHRAHSFVKKTRLISRALKHFGHSKLGSMAHFAGYGRRRRRYHRVRGRGLNLAGGALNPAGWSRRMHGGSRLRITNLPMAY